MNSQPLNAPAGWRRMKLKYLVALKSGDAIPGEEIKELGEYPVYGGNGFRGYTSSFTHEGERILIGRQGALCGNINYAKGRFWATEHAIVATPVAEFDTAWLGETLRAMNLNQYSQSAAQPGIAVEVIENLDIAVPPANEQSQIASLLRRITLPIDALIEEKQRLLHLLAEKRRAVIADLVTKGLDKNAPRCDSGIPWLGEIPEHWQAFPLRRLICTLEQGWSPVASNLPADPDEIGVLKLSAIKNGRFVPDENKALAPDAEIPAGLSVCEGDVFITRANTPKLVGDVALSERDYANLIFSDLIYRLKIDARRALPAWMVLALLSDIGRTQIESEAKGSSGSMVKLAQDQVLGIVLPVPPLMEQQAIVEYVQNEINKLDALAGATERTIALLQERRSVLLSAAVTGQIAIGEASA